MTHTGRTDAAIRPHRKWTKRTCRAEALPLSLVSLAADAALCNITSLCYAKNLPPPRWRPTHRPAGPTIAGATNAPVNAKSEITHQRASYADFFSLFSAMQNFPKSDFSSRLSGEQLQLEYPIVLVRSRPSPSGYRRPHGSRGLSLQDHDRRLQRRRRDAGQKKPRLLR
jgi:hypothetical protein